MKGLELNQLPLRTKLELLSGLVILVFCWSVFLLTGRYQTTLTYNNGQLVYEGQVKNHRMTGKGKLTYPNGDTYDGEFVNGVFNGKGLFTSSQGWTYEGEFQSGQPHGEGTLTAADKTVYQGQFKQGIYQK